MIESLVIRLGRDAAAVQYLLVDAAGARLGAVISGTLSQAAGLAVGRKIIVVVPAVDVLLAQPELPAKNATRLAQLAPYALEEQLVTEIDAMHFAIGKREASGKTPVAAVLRQSIAHWIEALNQAGIQPNALYSEASLLPITAGGVSLVLDQNLLYVRSAGATGFALDALPLNDAVHLALARGEPDADSEHNPEKSFIGDLQLFVSQNDYETQSDAIAELRQSIPSLQIKLLPEGPLPLFALQTVQEEPLNLLFGAYERKSSLSSAIAPWRYAAALVAVAVALQLIYGGLRLWQAIRSEKQLDAQIMDVARQTLPGVNVTDSREVRSQFESRLGTLKSSGGRNDLLTSLATLGDALTSASGARVEALSYRAQIIDLRVTAPNVDAIAKIQQIASANGLATQIQSATPRDNKVEGRLQLKL